MNKVAVVTGGAGNIGQAVVERLAKDNYSIVILDMNPDAGKQVVGDFATRNINLDFHCANLSDETAVKTACDAVFAAAIGDVRGDIDDGAGLLLLHRHGHGAAAEEGCCEIGVDDGAPVIEREIFELVAEKTAAGDVD